MGIGTMPGNGCLEVRDIEENADAAEVEEGAGILPGSEDLEEREIEENTDAGDERDAGTGLGTRHEELPTAGLASRLEVTSTEMGVDSGGGDCALRGEEDELDPATGIPLRWAEFWRQANADRSIGVGVPDPHERHSAPVSDIPRKQMTWRSLARHKVKGLLVS